MRIRWRGLELPTRVVCDSETLSDTYGMFTVEPFERGLGTTVGNSLRRVLLSSLEGSAVTSVRIQGVRHEFSTVPGMVEDVTEVILNIKGLVLRSYSDTTRTIHVERGQQGVVTAADIQTDDQVEIRNRDHVIATLSSDIKLSMEMEVRNGRGYVTAEENATEDQEIGVIPIDAVFSPVLRVRYSVEDTRVGQRTNYEKLNLEIWTDGTIDPEMALVEAAKILRKHLNPFVQYFEPGPQLPTSEQVEPGGDTSSVLQSELEAKLQKPIGELQLSARAWNCLKNENISTVGELVRRSEEEVMGLRHFGKISLEEIREKLADVGLSLGMDVPVGR